MPMLRDFQLQQQLVLSLNVSMNNSAWLKRTCKWCLILCRKASLTPLTPGSNLISSISIGWFIPCLSYLLSWFAYRFLSGLLPSSLSCTYKPPSPLPLNSLSISSATCIAGSVPHGTTTLANWLRDCHLLSVPP